MSSIQERLQLKRVPLDTWNVREQLCLASAVVRSGDQNWMSVSRALKTVGEPNRPPDWYSQKSCAAQYGALLEHVETPKRKKRSSEGAVETPQESILKRLTQDRILEIQKTLADMNQQYDQLKNEIAEVHNPSTSEERLQELWTGIETAKRTRERENARRAAWLKEREDRRARAERTWRPPQTPPAVAATPPAPSSPLLTSLLKSSPVVTTPQHLPHPATVVETISPSAGAPTLSMLLEKAGGGAHESKHAAIEHIKSQLVQIEQQLKANTTTPQPVPLAPAPAVDIDDIEIKAEDVYAFRDIDIHIPPVTTMHKGTPRPTEKTTIRKEDAAPIEMVQEPQVMEIDEEKVEPPSTESINEEVLAAEIEMPDQSEPEPERPDPVPRQATPEPEVRAPFPEVKFPTPEIKVIQPEVVKIKEDVREVEPPPEEKQREPEESVKVEELSPVEEESLVSKPSVPEQNEEVVQVKTEHEAEEAQAEDSREEKETRSSPEETPIERSSEQHDTEIEAEAPPVTPEAEVSMKEEQVDTPEEVPVEEAVAVPEEESVEQKLIEDIKKEDDAEDSIPLKEMMKEESQPLPQQLKEEKSQEVEDTHTETDDDTPMELSREEEKDGKKKRDYSRKKKSDSRTRSGSESAPESPSAGDAERQHRLWRKSVMLVYSRLCAHKYASLFLRPISDEEAPGYSAAVKRPMDLSAVRRNIDSGVVRTTAEFQRDVLLMLSNALMYNSSEHSVYSMAKEMFEEAQGQLGMLLAAQAHAGLCCAPPRRKRKAPERH